MRLLLDTNALLWALTNSPRIVAVKDLLLASESEVFVSAVSWWEIAIKTRIGRLDADLQMLRSVSQESGFLELPLLGAHTDVLATLPSHHNELFDHMLVAQAIVEPMRLITGDGILSKYTPWSYIFDIFLFARLAAKFHQTDPLHFSKQPHHYAHRSLP